MFTHWKWKVEDWLYNHEDYKIVSLILGVRRLYWHYVPYDYRPGTLYYKLKCFLFKRYTTVKCRYLPHTWCDCDTIFLHSSMEILSRFLENECSPGYVDWDSDDNHRHAMSEMRAIYEWWHKDYIPNFYHGKHIENLAKQIPEQKDITIPCEGSEHFVEWKILYNTPEDEEKANRIYREMTEYENSISKTEKEMLKRLVDVMDYMWT